MIVDTYGSHSVMVIIVLEFVCTLDINCKSRSKVKKIGNLMAIWNQHTLLCIARSSYYVTWTFRHLWKQELLW